MPGSPKKRAKRAAEARARAEAEAAAQPAAVAPTAEPDPPAPAAEAPAEPPVASTESVLPPSTEDVPPAEEPAEVVRDAYPPIDPPSDPAIPNQSEGDARAPAPAPARRVLSNSDPEHDPLKRDLQFRAWLMRTRDKFTYRQIAARLEIDLETASYYCRLEAERRSAQTSQERDLEIQAAVATYEDVERYYLEKMRSPTAKGDEGRLAIQARQALDELLGLAAKPTTETPTTASILAGLPGPSIAALLRAAAERKRKRLEEQSK